MKMGSFALLMVLAVVDGVSANADESQKVYMLSKRETLDTTNTLVVLFHDKAITTMEECQKEIFRGNREQWRYYHHSFPRAAGYSENRDYLCISGALDVDAWNKDAPYDNIYQIDVRTPKVAFIKMKSLAACLHNLRGISRTESRKFFCGKLSQLIK